MLFAATIVVVQDVIVTAIDCAFYIYTLLMYTNTRSIEAEQIVCSKTPTPEIGLQNVCAYKMRILSSFLSDWLTSLNRLKKCLDFMSLKGYELLLR